MLTSGFDPCITIAGSNNLVRKLLEILLGVGVIESSSDESLGSEDSIFGVSYCLYIIIN